MTTHPHPTPRHHTFDIDDLVGRFEARTLPKAEWTHEAHLTVCLDALRRLGPERALAHLRTAILAYNDAVGTPNTDTSGYHETLTRYYLGAVAHAEIDDPAALAGHPACGREAPLRHWTRERLFSTAARRGWEEPDVELPWP